MGASLTCTRPERIRRYLDGAFQLRRNGGEREEGGEGGEGVREGKEGSVGGGGEGKRGRRGKTVTEARIRGSREGTVEWVSRSRGNQKHEKRCITARVARLRGYITGGGNRT